MRHAPAVFFSLAVLATPVAVVGLLSGQPALEVVSKVADVCALASWFARNVLGEETCTGVLLAGCAALVALAAGRVICARWEGLGLRVVIDLQGEEPRVRRLARFITDLAEQSR